MFRAGDAFANFHDIPFFLYTRDRKNINRDVIIFIGEGIDLIDLKTLYYFLKDFGIYKVSLVLNKKSVADYEIFVDRIHVWRDDYLSFMKEQNIIAEPLPPPPPPSPRAESRQAFLGDNGELIGVNSVEDFDKLSGLSKGKNYVVLINNTMSFKDYIELKALVYKLAINRRIPIVTEII